MKAIYELFLAILSDSASDEERTLFQKEMTDPENQALFEKVKAIWNESSNLQGYHKVDQKRAFAELNRKLEAKKRDRKRFFLTSGISVAASVLLMIGLFTWIQFGNTPQNAVIAVQTELGNRTLVYLPDSTKVWLNSLSQLSYSNTFGKDSREVKLTGEGFFEVTHSDVPFVVDVKDFQIKVYGTKFNVSAYKEDPEVLTVLQQGSIGINSPGMKEIKLEPGQMATFQKKKKQFLLAEVNPGEYSSWTSNKMYLHEENMGSLARKLERKFNVDIEFYPESIAQEIHYSGVFDVENVEEILDAISLASELNYKKEGNHYLIKRN